MKTVLCSFFLVWIFAFVALAQEQTSIAYRTAQMEAFEGFFDFYWDETAGEIFLEIDKLNHDFLYVNYLATGIGSNKIGLDRGQLGKTKVVYFERIGNKIYLIQRNLKYRSSSSNRWEHQAVEESFPPSILHAWFIEAQDKNKYLINFSDFLVRDVHGVPEQIQAVHEGNYEFDFLRSAMYMKETKNFPKNTDFETLITFTRHGKIGEDLQQVSNTPELLTVRQHHSLVELPDSNYLPRQYVPACGYFPLAFYDFSASIHQDIQTKYIARHRLEKKHPNLAQSKAIKPIIYYVDRGIPEPFRTAVMQGASWWNEAFEAIGFRDAFQVKLLPEHIDPDDIRYHVIRWVHRKERGWSYGTSVRDPRTGEIIKANVVLGSLRMRYDYLIAQGLTDAPFRNDSATHAQPELLAMALARIRQLAVHEVGHTLGLMHNFASSADDGQSVMDYPHPNIRLTADNQIDLSEAYRQKLGKWDIWAIAYGYSVFPSENEEQAQLKQLLDLASAQNLQFISDQDAREIGGLHPTAHLWDNGSDVIEELNKLLKIRELALKQFSEKNIPLGTPHALLEEVLVPIYNLHRYQAEAVAKLIAGMNYSYAVRGDKQHLSEVVLNQKQEKALEILLKCLSPEILTLPEHIIHLIPPHSMDYANPAELFVRKTGLSFDPISTANVSANYILGLLLHPERISRLIEFKARFGGMGLDKVYEDLIQTTWKSSRKTGLALEVQRNTEQEVLRYLLQLSQSSQLAGQAKALTFFQLQNLRNYIENEHQKATDVERKAHLQYALYQIDNPTQASIKPNQTLPRGAPLGCGIHQPHH